MAKDGVNNWLASSVRVLAERVAKLEARLAQSPVLLPGPLGAEPAVEAAEHEFSSSKPSWGGASRRGSGACDPFASDAVAAAKQIEVVLDCLQPLAPRGAPFRWNVHAAEFLPHVVAVHASVSAEAGGGPEARCADLVLPEPHGAEPAVEAAEPAVEAAGLATSLPGPLGRSQPSRQQWLRSSVEERLAALRVARKEDAERRAQEERLAEAQATSVPEPLGAEPAVEAAEPAGKAAVPATSSPGPWLNSCAINPTPS